MLPSRIALWRRSDSRMKLQVTETNVHTTVTAWIAERLAGRVEVVTGDQRDDERRGDRHARGSPRRPARASGRASAATRSEAASESSRAARESIGNADADEQQRNADEHLDDPVGGGEVAGRVVAGDERHDHDRDRGSRARDRRSRSRTAACPGASDHQADGSKAGVSVVIRRTSTSVTPQASRQAGICTASSGTRPAPATTSTMISTVATRLPRELGGGDPAEPQVRGQAAPTGG